MSDFFEILECLTDEPPSFLKYTELDEQKLLELMEIVNLDLRRLEDETPVKV